MTTRKFFSPMFGLALLFGAGARLAAQQNDVYHLATTFRPGARPGVIVLSGQGLDIVRAIIDTDLVQSHRFEMPPLPDSAARLQGPFDPATMKGSPIYVVELQPAPTGVDVKLYQLQTGDLKQKASFPIERTGTGDSRLGIHRISDKIVNWITGAIGIASSRIAFLQDPTGKASAPGEAGIFRIDADGQNRMRVSPRARGSEVYSPTWASDATRVAYTDRQNAGNQPIQILNLETGNAVSVPTTNTGTNWNATFSRDGKMLVFARIIGDATNPDLWIANTSNISSVCCARALTTSAKQGVQSLSPTFNADGQTIAYERAFTSPGAGSQNQIWVVDADGGSPHALFSFTGKAHQPNWSPDGSKIVFDGETDEGNSFQIYYYNVLTGKVVQVTSNDRNEHATWAPDSRHLVFQRTVRGQKPRLVVWDTESNEQRYLDTPAGQGARYVTWSGIIGGNTP